MKKCKLLDMKSINVFINESIYTLENGEEYDDIIANLFPEYFGKATVIQDISSSVEVIIEIEE